MEHPAKLTLNSQIGWLCGESMDCMLFFEMNSLSTINDVLRSPKVQTRISFWGTRIVEYKGDPQASSDNTPLALNDLTQRVVRAASAFTQGFEMKSPSLQSQLKAGADILERLKEFYVLTDAQLKNAFFITKIFNWIQGLFYGDQREEIFRAEKSGLFKSIRC